MPLGFGRLTSPYRLQISQVKSLLTELSDRVEHREMDLQAASRLSGMSSQLAKIVALLCFVVAGGILIASHARAAQADFSPAKQRINISTAR